MIHSLQHTPYAKFISTTHVENRLREIFDENPLFWKEKVPDWNEEGWQKKLKEQKHLDLSIKTENGPKCVLKRIEELAYLLDSCPSLNSLSLKGCKNIFFLRLVSNKNPKLIHLNLSSSILPKCEGGLLDRFSKLKYLDISDSQLDDEWLPCIYSLKNLEQLNLSNNQFTDKGLPDLLGRLHKLKSLNLSSCNAVTHRALKPLLFSKSIRSLNIQDCAVTKEINKTIRLLRRFNNLESLIIGSASIKLEKSSKSKSVLFKLKRFVRKNSLESQCLKFPHLQKLFVNGKVIVIKK